MTAHAEQEAFLQAVLANPEDDVARLVYADWLQENAEVPCPSCVAILSPDHGGCWPCRECGAKNWAEHATVRDPDREARAEFIRCQCRIAAIARDLQSEEDCEQPGCADCEERRLLRRRERELLTTHYHEWFPCPKGRSVFPVNTAQLMWGYGEPVVYPVDVTRGFVSSVTCTHTDWRKHGPALARQHPITRVTLAGKQPDERWYWWRDNESGFYNHNPAYLPPDLFALLPNIIHLIAGAKFDTRELALDALSQACLTWAKEQEPTTLTPLPESRSGEFQN